MTIQNRYRITASAPHVLYRAPEMKHWCRLYLEGVAGGKSEAPEHGHQAALGLRCAACDFLPIPFADFHQDLVASGPQRSRPAFPVPGAAEVVAVGSPRYGGRPVGASAAADAATLAIVAVALAWRAGAADDYELEEDLVDVLGDRDAAGAAREVARLRSRSNIRLAGRRWHLESRWTLPGTL